MESRIDNGMVVTAKISGDGDLTVRGCLEGDIDLPKHDLNISPGGWAEGTATVQNAFISGEFRGKLTASHRVVLHATGVITGEIQAASMEIKEGAIINGSYTIGNVGS